MHMSCFSLSRHSCMHVRTSVFDSVDEWLESIDSTSSTSFEGNEERDCKYLWYHLACPTRIAKHKDGVCEASSFDNLDDDLYKKTVKPAHSSFGVVSYDETTDSTLLVRRNSSKERNAWI